ncbi:ABC transporter substrate-binding protein [Solibacillus cecembensis]|uniref:ABC transporter substrate-binding protein n=1 Tax=Solibacillus cecembensis TaxID=459347 RepID=UPI0007173139
MKITMKWVAPFAAALLLTACSTNEKIASQPKDEANQEQQGSNTNEPYKVVDDRGVEVTFDTVPNTIVSLQPSNTEILFELGVGDKIVGATDFDTYPEAAQNIERVSTSTAINAERILELNPDVVVAYTVGDEAQISQLEDVGLKVFVIKSAANFDDVYSDIIQLSEVMGVEPTGEKIVKDIQAQIKEVQDKTAKLETKKKVFYEISPSPDIWTTGSETFQQEIMDAAGIDNVFADQKSWISVTEEDVIIRNPEVIVTTNNYIDDPTGEIMSRAGWDKISALTNKQVFLVNGDIMSRPAPRIGQAVQIMAETVYPELFK